MDLNELLQVLWRRKLTVAITTALVIGLAVLSLQVATPQYQASSTVVLTPKGKAQDLTFFFTLKAIVPIYANAVTSSTTRNEAAQATGGKLAKISVQTSTETPLLEIKARDPDAGLARESAQAVTDVLLSRVEAGEVGIPTIQVNQLEVPTTPTLPVFPRRNLTLAIATLLGLGFGIGMALLRETLTSRVETSDELALATGVPVYGEIPLERKIPRLRAPEDLQLTEFRILAEAMRDLRTNLQFSENGFRSVVVTSPQGRHGKTTISFGLATTLARTGAKTLLVDGDLRRGRVAEMLQLPRSPGLWDALAGAQIAQCIRPTSLKTLHVMPSGRPVDNPGEVLSTKFASFLEDLEKSYDIVVIDSTPLVPVNDARIMASAASTTLIVANAETTKRRQIRDAIERLALVSVQPTAAILNRSKAPRGDYYYGEEPRQRQRR